MSDGLKQFYRELWAWVQDGCPMHKIFRCERSLRVSVTLWSQMYMPVGLDLAGEQYKIFDALAGSTIYPFNHDSSCWLLELKNGTFYQNPKRLAFIEEHAK
ncbi:hypothetical protein ACLEEJ_00360 [Lonsdalea quercina]|uniref:hypothetical protein n=1 Tax=Lonsdalea quercina TaxID=71657 RepID=UPI003976573A